MSGSDAHLEAGWRPDPTGRYDFRYWDGAWTNRVAAAPNPTDDDGGSRSPSTPSDPRDTPAPQAVVDAHEVPTDLEALPEPSPSVRGIPTERGGAVVSRPRRSVLGAVWGGVGRFFRSFADQPESYQSQAAVDIEDVRRSASVLGASPLPYGRAALVSLSACAIAAGSSLPWLSGTIGGVAFHQSGFDAGDGESFLTGALLLSVA